MAVQAVVAIVLGIYALSQLRRFNNEQTVRELARVTPLVSDRVRPLLEPARRQELEAETSEVSRRAGVRTTIVRPDGTVLADSERDPALMDNHRDRAEIVEAMEKGSGSAVRRSATLGLDMVYLADTLTTNGETIAVVRTARPVGAVDAEFGRVLRIVSGAALFSLLFTLGVIYFISRRLSRTVGRLAEGAKRFAAGDLTHALPHPKTREFASLADNLGEMARQLSDKIARLQSQQAEQSAIMSSMTSGLLALDQDQRVISANRAAESILGFQGAHARGRLLQELVREPDLNRFVQSALAEGVLREELELQRGPRVEAVSAPLLDSKRQAEGVLVFIDDVTKLRRLESIRSDFAANVSHELRTPITNILGYVETMLEVGCGDEKQTTEFLNVIRRSAERLAAIIEDLLALARLEQSDRRASLALTPLRATELVRSAVASIENAARDKSITIVREIDPDLVLDGAEQLLEQALGNLISNAVRYSAEGTHVTVRARRTDEGTVASEVADEGPGIPPQHLSRIFERFYRVDPARSRELGGTGLGLAIVKHVAIVHGGRAEAESIVGRGSVFRIVLPDSARE